MIGRIISHYKILEKLGQGGMGIIYKAEDLKLTRTVVLKVLPESLNKDEEFKQRFILEAQNASSLQHNNICTIHEIDETPDGQLFISMDYYEGESLRKRISRDLLSVDEMTGITLQIAEGLYKAHENKIIHRDIKPANIFITKDGTVKILDFGLAKRIDRTQFTRTGIKFGTTDYMSPEQIKGEKVDRRTDIWSLGIVLYEMLTGQHPFQADNEQAILYLILNQEPEDVSKYRTDAPAGLVNILEKSLAKEREDRYEDMAWMIKDLRKVSSQSKVEAEKFEIPAPRPSQSIAVLPFVNISADSEQEYFCDGLTEELINALSRIKDLRVVARTSAFSFKGGSYDIRKVGRQLNVQTVLEGSVRKYGDRIRITAQLINVMDGYHLWSERYDREVKDLFVIQDEISLAIVEVLKVKLLEGEKGKLVKRYTDNVVAYNYYIQGLYFLNQLNISMLGSSIEFFNQALKIDPNYALAYYGLGYCQFGFCYFGLKRTREVKPEMAKCIQKALEIDENLSGAYNLLGLSKACLEWKWAEAQSAWQRSIELNPNDAFALSNFSINRVSWGQFDLARKLSQRAKTIDPLSDYTELCCVFPDFYTARFDRVLERISRYSELNPPYWWGLWFLWRTLSLVKRKFDAVKVCKKAFMVAGLKDVVQAMETAGVDHAIETAASILADVYPQHYSSPYDIAALFIHAGKKEQAIHWLAIAVEEHDPKLHFFNADPDWQAIRDDERFIKLLKTVGFRT
jgi:serine/threonine protein kinase/tetratricopeptide (TPR) repeat protein